MIFRILLAACLMQLGATPVCAQVNLQSGAAETSFPLIKFSDAKSGLALGVGINYSSGNGLVVNSISSPLGTGWTLEAGGMISRVQVGLPDDQPENNNGQLTGEQSLKRYAAGYLYNSGVGLGCPQGIDKYPVFKDDNQLYKQKNNIAADLEQDRFFFEMNGHAGSFVIGRDWKAYSVGDSKVKITMGTRSMTAQGIRTTIDTFAIITEDGIKYGFSAKSLTQLTRYKYSKMDSYGNWTPLPGKPSDAPRALNRFWGYPLGQDERPYIVSSWHLTSIANLNTGESILLTYTDSWQDVVNGKHISHSRDLNNSGRVAGINPDGNRKENGRKWFSLLSDPANALLYSSNTAYLDKLKPGPSSLTYLRSITNSKRLSTILLPNGGQIIFSYSTIERVDLPGNFALSQIDYILRSKVLSRYQFAQGYFFKNTMRSTDNSWTTYEKKFARLCLLSVQKMASENDYISEPPHQFSYYLGGKGADDMVPARNYLSQDHWGYYNGDLSGLSLTEDHDQLSDPENQYFKTVLYNSHQLKENYAKNGLLRTITYPTGGTMEYQYSQAVRKLPLVTTEAKDGGVAVSTTTVFDGESHSRDVVTTYSYQGADGKSSRWGYEQPVYTNLSQTVYDEKWGGKKYKHTGIEYPEMAVMSPAMGFNWGKFLFNAAIGFAAQSAMAAMLPASAVPILNAMVLAASVILFIVNALKEFEFHRFNLTNANAILGNPIGNRYSQVEVRTNSPTGYNGKTEYQFTSVTDYPLLEPKHEWPFTQKQRMAPWVYGLLKKLTVFDKDNRLVSEKQQDYKMFLEKIADQQNQNCVCASRSQSSIRSDDWSSLGGYVPFTHNLTWALSPVKPQAYFSFTGRADLNAAYEKEYTNGNLYQSRVTSYTTDPVTLLPKGQVYQKDMSGIAMTMQFFPTDYDLSGAIAVLKANNAIHTPVASETWLMKVEGPFPHLAMYLVDATVTEFNTYTVAGKTVVKPWKTYALKTKTPLSSSVIGTHNRNQLIRNPAYFKLTGEFLYDAEGNLVQEIRNEHTTSFINDYASRFVTATVQNAAAADIGYTSFESNGTGNWLYNAGAIANDGLTGGKAFQLGAGASISTKNTLSASKNYIVTYWHKSGGAAPTVGSSGAELLYETDDGWKLYKHQLTGVTSITISGTGLIDELRLYPENSSMTTVVYDEGIGKVAESDANSRIVYYEYDGLGRMKLVRDQERNVIKTYEYNYKK